MTTLLHKLLTAFCILSLSATLCHAEESKPAFLGISVMPASPALRAQLELRDGEGMVIAWVHPGSPAEKSGLKQYDLVLELDGKVISTESDLARIAGDAAAGDKVSCWIVRKTKHQAVDVTFGERPTRRLPDKTKKKTPKINEIPTGAVIDLGFPAMGQNMAVSFMIHDGRFFTRAHTDKNGNVQVTVRDFAGKIIHSGSVTSKEDQDKLPESVRKQLTEKGLLR